jgi:hypothetical protein
MADIENVIEDDVADDAAVDAMLAMSDDEIANMVAPPASNSAPVEEQEEKTEPTAEEAEEKQEDDDAGDSADDDSDEPSADADKPKQSADSKKAADPAKGDAQEPNAGDEPKEPEVLNYEESYKKIMAPFKANGKEIKLSSPEEAVKLMQMGANYTKKMQALQPHLKMVKMLENHNLLDENKLSYLIDLSKNDPKAIQKLVKESGMDPLDIDSSTNQDYRPNNYTVSDQEFKFNQTVEDLKTSDDGIEILRDVSTQWDSASKAAVFNEPETLAHLLAQKQSGIYEQINAEIEKQQMLGNLRGVPYLQAYTQVGQFMQQNNMLSIRAPQPESRIIDTRKATPKSEVSNGDKVRAAAPTKTSPVKKAQEFNPLAMSDEDFLKSDFAKTL